MAESIRRSALVGLLEIDTFGVNAQEPAVTLAERRPAALLRLFAAVDDGDFESVVHSMTALPPPRTPNTAIAGDDRALLWLAPGQWLLVCDEERSAFSEAELQAAFNGTAGTVVDVSHAYAGLAISGERARDVLAKGISVDLDATAFATGACAQTLLTDMNVVLYAREAQALDLYVGRSYAVSLWEWLRASAAEFSYRSEGSGTRA
jgi:heterotetrameric sarcosine oxidase gamma subunit